MDLRIIHSMLNVYNMEYNIYYKGSKINQIPLSETTLKQIYEYKDIFKKTSNGNIRIPVSKIVVAKCITI